MKSTQAIGFGGTFYTLWTITKEMQYAQNSWGQYMATHERITYTYHKNISTSEQKARELHPGLTVDTSLKGTKSWWVEVSTVCDMPKHLSPFVEFGKYKGQLVAEVEDLSYLGWYFKETGNRYAKAILMAAGELFEAWDENMQEFYFIDKREHERRQRMASAQEAIEAMAKKGEVYTGAVLTNVFNVDEAKMYGADAKIKIEFEGKPLVFICKDYKEMFYGDLVYGLPLVNGKAKKAKNKLVRFTVEPNGEHEAFVKILEVLKTN